MRALSVRAAARCEQACTSRCRCRCGGVLHGAGRLQEVENGEERAFLAGLPADDPHYVAERPIGKKRTGIR